VLWPLEEHGDHWLPSRPLPVGARYGFRLGASDEVLADPRSRWQPDGPDGLSEVIEIPVIDPGAGWNPPGWTGAVIYELHVGTFSAAGASPE